MAVCKPPPFRRIGRNLVVALVLLFLLAFAAVVWYSVTSSSIAMIAIAVPMAMLKLIPMTRNSLEQRVRADVATRLKFAELPCSECETRIQIGRDEFCPHCKSSLTVAEHRARWGV